MYSQAEYKAPTIREILKRSEDQIDIGEAALVLAKEFYPTLNIPHFLYIFDYMANRFNALLKAEGYYKPEDKIKLLNTYLYQKGWWNDSITFSYDDEDYYRNGLQGVSKQSNRFINGYIATKKGSCITMPMLYLIIAERIDLPLYPVLSPKHFFVRYVPNELTEKFQANIETTNGGSFLSDQTYIDDAGIPKVALKRGTYLRTLSKKEYIATLCAMNGTLLADKGKFKKGKSYLWLALKYHKNLAMAYWNYGIIHLEWAKRQERVMKSQIISTLIRYEAMNRNLNRSRLDPLHNRSYSNPVDLFANVPSITRADFGRFFDVPEEVFEFKKHFPNFFKPKAKRLKIENPNQNMFREEQQMDLMNIKKEYESKILDSYKTYDKFTKHAEYLGIVKKLPTEFFQKQLKMFKQYVKEGKIKL